MTNTNLLKGALAARGMTMEKLAEMLSMTAATMSYKANNIRQFKAREISAIQKILNLSSEERDNIFFSEDVE